MKKLFIKQTQEVRTHLIQNLILNKPMFSLFKKKEFFSKEENDKIIAAIRHAEECTSGEVRVFVERRCKFIDPLDRAMEIFADLKMQNTKDRNAVLVYVAIKDKQLAIYGDSGIHAKTGEE